MHTRQLTESFGINGRDDIFGCKRGEQEPGSYQHKCTNGLHGSMVAKTMSDGEAFDVAASKAFETES